MAARAATTAKAVAAKAAIIARVVVRARPAAKAAIIAKVVVPVQPAAKALPKVAVVDRVDPAARVAPVPRAVLLVPTQAVASLAFAEVIAMRQTHASIRTNFPVVAAIMAAASR